MANFHAVAVDDLILVPNTSGYQTVHDQSDDDDSKAVNAIVDNLKACKRNEYQPVNQNEHNIPIVNSSATTVAKLKKGKENFHSIFESSLLDETTSDDLLKSFLGMLYMGILFYAFLWLDSEESRSSTGPLELGVNSISMPSSLQLSPHHNNEISAMNMINTTFVVRNHRNLSSIFFEEIEASVSYKGILLSTTFLPRFYLGRQEPVELETRFSLQASPAPVIGSMMEEWRERRVVVLDTRLQGLVKIDTGAFDGKEAWFKGFCWNVWVGRKVDGKKHPKGCHVFLNGWDGETIDLF